MNNLLPSIHPRSLTPVNVQKSQKKKLPSHKNYFYGSHKYVSLTPTRKSVQKTQTSELIQPLTVSVEVNSIPFDRESLSIKPSSIFSKKLGVIKSHKKIFENPKNYSQVADALFSIYRCEGSRLSAYNLISLFVSLGCCENSEQIVDILSNTSDGLPLKRIWYSKEDILRICEDHKSENIMKALIRNSPRYTGKTSKLQCLLTTIKNWWTKLDKSGTDLVNTDEIIKFYSDIGLVENTNDVKRALVRMNQFAGFKEFSMLFSKTLFRFLIQEIGAIIKQGKMNFVPAEMAITAQRRKNILKGVEGRNGVLDAMAGCYIYNI